MSLVDNSQFNDLIPHLAASDLSQCLKTYIKTRLDLTFRLFFSGKSKLTKQEKQISGNEMIHQKELRYIQRPLVAGRPVADFNMLGVSGSRQEVTCTHG